LKLPLILFDNIPLRKHNAGAKEMDFFIDRQNSTPVAKQIEEQIKLAVMMGIFRNGDTLPSIRDIERQTGIKRSQIHKAFLNLKESGLVVLTRGKGSIIATACDNPKSMDEKCRKLCKSVISKARQLGISPTAFTRYLGLYAQDGERKEPFIAYVDIYQEAATQTAAKISQLWQVPVAGMGMRELMNFICGNSSIQRFLACHIMYDDVRDLLAKQKSVVIPVEIYYSPKTIRKLEKIKSNASIQLILWPHPSHRIHFMIAQLQKLIKSPGIRISPVFIDESTDFRELLGNSEYNYSIVGPGVRCKVPRGMRGNPGIVRLEPKLDSASLEAARIRAGVVL
jgi:DNA-binding transcriptional regulator YhcF (GntR family)